MFIYLSIYLVPEIVTIDVKYIFVKLHIHSRYSSFIDLVFIHLFLRLTLCLEI